MASLGSRVETAHPSIGALEASSGTRTATICITGSAGGIGSATRARLEAAGHRVIGVDVADAEVHADLSTREGRASMIADVARQCDGALDGLIAAAGISGDDGPLTVSINYFGAVAALEGLRPLLARGADASAVALSSNSATATAGVISDAIVEACLSGDEAAARTAVPPGFFAYPSTKLALARWARRAATTAPWLGSGIRLNVIAPGPIATPMTAGISDVVLELGDVYPVPIGRLGRPEEVAAVLDFLLSPEAAYVVGSMVFVDGGGDAAVRADDWPAARS